MNITKRYLSVDTLPKSKKARISNWGRVLSTPSKEICRKLGIPRERADQDYWPESLKATQREFFLDGIRDTDVRGEIFSVVNLRPDDEIDKDVTVALKVGDFYVIISIGAITEEDD